MPRVSAAQKEEGRKRLLEAAAQHFAQHGYDGASIDRIAIAAGFAKGSLYNYFESKGELFGEVLAEACRRAAERYRAQAVKGSVRERLDALVRADLSVLEEEEAFFRVLIREALAFRPETFATVIEHLGPFLALVREALEVGARAGEVRTDLPADELALLFVGILALLYVQHWGSQGVWPPRDGIPELVVTAFLDGAGRPAPGRPRAVPETRPKETGTS